MKSCVSFGFLLIVLLASNSQCISPNSKILESYHHFKESSLVSEFTKRFQSCDSNLEQCATFNSKVNRNSVLLLKSLVPGYVKDLIQNEEFGRVIAKNAAPLQELVNEVCLGHLQMFFKEINNTLWSPLSIAETSTWALQMIDAWGKIPEGILSGHVNSYGDWDECVNVRAEENLGDLPNFQGHYFWMFLVPIEPDEEETAKSNPTQSRKAASIPELIENMANPVGAVIVPSIALCLPSSCSMDEIQSGLYYLFQLPGSPLNSLEPFIYYSNTDEKAPLSTGAKSMIIILSILGFLIAVGTGFDSVLLLKKDSSEVREKLPVRLIMSFSLVTNIRKWQDTSSDGGFGCIHGIRVLSTCWVILCHTIDVMTIQPPPWNLIDLNHIYKRAFPIYFILNGMFTVDTFFTMSGLLACLSILKALEKTKGRLNIFKVYVHRYLRITPTYAILIGVLATIYPYFGDGPQFPLYADQAAKNCQSFWWHNLLYFNNVYHYNGTKGEFMCERISWYIANDMQFFILSPLFAYLLWRWQYIGMGVLGAASIASILTPAIKVGTEKLAPTVIVWKSNPELLKVYNEPWFRIGPYLVGMWMGYILFKIGKKPVVLPKLVVIGGWILSTVTALTLILGVIPNYNPDHVDDPVASAFYAGLSRFCWGIVICWIIFTCVKGYGGWVNSFLSMKVFIPLGRLTFCVYLSSLSVQILLQHTIRQPMYVTMYSVTNLFFSHVIMCFLVGFAATLVLESPFIALEKIVLGGGGGGAKAKQPPGKNEPGDLNHNENPKFEEKSDSPVSSSLHANGSSELDLKKTP